MRAAATKVAQKPPSAKPFGPGSYELSNVPLKATMASRIRIVLAITAVLFTSSMNWKPKTTTTMTITPITP